MLMPIKSLYPFFGLTLSPDKVCFDMGSALSFVEILMESNYVVTIPSSYQSNLLQARDGVRCPRCEPIPLFGSRS